MTKVLLFLFISATFGRLSQAKVFDHCELAQTLRQRHGLSLSELANWVCIAQHSSDFNTSAYAAGPKDASHGIFQISDVYWCSPTGEDSVCDVPCFRLRDDDLTDDLACARIIHAEHQRISGNGYDAWHTYSQYCRHGVQMYIDDCFPREQLTVAPTQPAASHSSNNSLDISSKTIENYSPQNSSKVYERCELAQELYYRLKLPMDQIATWVCIVQYESNFDTAAIGSRNADGSLDYGLFQISDLYWCSHGSNGGDCSLNCNKLLDDDISDDVRCIRRIHSEHSGISGDGFTAWTVYDEYCRDQLEEHVAACFKQLPPVSKPQKNDTHTSTASPATRSTPILPETTKPSSKPHKSKPPTSPAMGSTIILPETTKPPSKPHKAKPHTSTASPTTRSTLLPDSIKPPTKLHKTKSHTRIANPATHSTRIPKSTEPIAWYLNGASTGRNLISFLQQ